MECENAYTKKGIRYILCKKAPEPRAWNVREEAHALCGHQRFCPHIRACTLLPTWEKCPRRDVNSPQTREEAAESEIKEAPKKAVRRKKASEKAKEKEN